MPFTLNLAVFPVVASLVAGTGALATYATAPSAPREVSAPEVPAPPQTAVPSPLPPAARSCDAQTWPYVDATCTKGSEERKVRVVTAPRASEIQNGPGKSAAAPHVPAPQSAIDAVKLPPNMTTSDTVLRSPDIVMPPRKVSKRERRSEQRRSATQSYRVPGAHDGRPRDVIVVRPLRLEAFR